MQSNTQQPTTKLKKTKNYYLPQPTVSLSSDSEEDKLVTAPVSSSLLSQGERPQTVSSTLSDGEIPVLRLFVTTLLFAQPTIKLISDLADNKLATALVLSSLLSQGEILCAMVSSTPSKVERP